MTSSAPAKWSEVRDALHGRWPNITPEEIDAAGGDRTRLMALLEFKLGYGPAMAADEVDSSAGDGASTSVGARRRQR